MKTKRTMTIGLVLPNILSPIWSTIARGVEDMARQASFSTIIYDTDEQMERMQESLRNLHQKRVDGIIVAPCGRCEDFLTTFTKHTDIPLVLVDRYLDDLPIDAVVSDSEQGAHQAVTHLLQTGRRRIGMVSLSLEISTGRDRVRGYQRAITEFGLPVHTDLIVGGGSGEREGYTGAQRLLSLPPAERPDALFLSSHLMTVGALKAIRERGLRVPDDIAVIGFDDLPWTSLLDPPLTVVSQPAYEMGARATERLVKRLTNREYEEPARREVLETKIVHRCSCCRLTSKRECEEQ
jgi:DNA-binding LacI/PurR family transcriptional regulator